MQGFVKGAAEAVVVAEEGGEGVAGIAPEDAAHEAGVLVELPVGIGVSGFGFGPVEFEVVAEIVEAIGDEAGFDAGDAAEAPVGGGHLTDEELLGGVLGLELGTEALEQFLKFLPVLLGQDDGAGNEAVFLGVDADDGFTLGGLGAGTAPGVATVGLDFLFAGHGTPPATE